MSTRSTRNTPRPKRAPRSKAPEPTPVPAPEPAPAKPSYARGNPLTHSVTFTDMSGTCWLVYVEPAPPEPALWPNAAVIPGRRLRFDSVDRSVTVSPFPAGAPFLQERTLQILLDQTQTRTTAPATTPAPAARVPAAAVPGTGPGTTGGNGAAPDHQPETRGTDRATGRADAGPAGERRQLAERCDLPAFPAGTAVRPGAHGDQGHDPSARPRLTPVVLG